MGCNYLFLPFIPVLVHKSGQVSSARPGTQNLNMLWHKQNDRNLTYDIFTSISFKENNSIFILTSWAFLSSVQSTALVQVIHAWRGTAFTWTNDDPTLTPYGVTRPQWVKISIGLFNKDRVNTKSTIRRHYYIQYEFCFVLLWFGTSRLYPYPSGLLHWYWAFTRLPRWQRKNHDETG